MKILFFSINTGSSPAWERLLELMKIHQNKGDEIYVVGCRGALESCYSNPEHNLPRCMYCKLRFARGVQRLKISQDKIFYLNDELRNPELVEQNFSSAEDLIKFKVFGMDIGEAVYSLLVSEFHNSEIDVVRYSSYIKRKLRTSLLVYESMLDILNKVLIDVVYVFNGRVHDVRPVMRLCQQKNIEYRIHEEGWGNFDTYIICQNTIPHSLQYLKDHLLATWEKGDKNRDHVAVEWFIQNRYNVQKNRHLEIMQQKKSSDALRQLGVYDKQFSKIILICISSLFEYKTFTEWKESFYQSDADAVERIARAFSLHKEYLFVVRVHPNLRGINNAQVRAFQQVDKKNIPNLRFVWAHETISTYQLLDLSFAVVTFLSTIGVEACFWHKPAILLGSAPYEDLDCCYRPTNHQELVDLLTQDLVSKPIAGALKYAYWRAAGGIKYKYFQPASRHEGVFEGKPIVHKYSPKKIPFWLARVREKLSGKE